MRVWEGWVGGLINSIHAQSGQRILPGKGRSQFLENSILQLTSSSLYQHPLTVLR